MRLKEINESQVGFPGALAYPARNLLTRRERELQVLAGLCAADTVRFSQRLSGESLVLE
jgi:hypothetical protein